MDDILDRAVDNFDDAAKRSRARRALRDLRGQVDELEAYCDALRARLVDEVETDEPDEIISDDGGEP